MKDARAVVNRVRGVPWKCVLCKGANWRRKRVKFAITGAVGDKNPFLLQLANDDILTGTTIFVCREHLQHAVEEVWK